MENVQLKFDSKGIGHFYIMEGNEQLGKMEVSILGSNLTVYLPKYLKKRQAKDMQRYC